MSEFAGKKGKERTEALVGALKQRTEAFRSSDEAFLRFVRASTKFHRYSQNNIWLILFQYPEASAVNSFKRWQELGRMVQKGEKAIWILAPMTAKNKDTDEIEVFGFRSVPVFAYEQTEPIPDAEHVWEPYRFPTLNEDVGSEWVQAIIDGLSDGCDIDLFDEEADYRGQFRVPQDDEQPAIKLWSQMPSLQQLNTLVHEWAHMEHWRLQHDSWGWGRGVIEFVAEASSYAVLQQLGFDSSEKSVSYIAANTDISDDREQAVVGVVVKVVDAIMAQLEPMSETLVEYRSDSDASAA